MIRLARAGTAALLLCAAPAMAAEDGAQGSSSTATMTISGTVLPPLQAQVRISGIDDIELGALAQEVGSFTVLDSNVCIFHTSPTFRLTVTQDEPPVIPGRFSLYNSIDAAFPLGLSLRLGEMPLSFTPGSTRTGLVANTQSQPCSIGPLAELAVSYSFPPNSALPAGTYQARLRFTVAAE